MTTSPQDGSAFLVRRHHGAWRDVYGLTPGQVTTIGRSSTNRIVVDDEVCSRNHCEVFQAGSTWVLRDLGSRNGTRVDGREFSGDWTLENGQIVQIGSFVLGFTHDITQLPDGVAVDRETATAELSISDHSSVDSVIEILHRRDHSEIASDEAANRYSNELAKLFRLGLELGTAETPAELADVVLKSLSKETVADICAILLLPAKLDEEPKPSNLQVVAYQTENDMPYHRVSDNLSETVLVSREAVMGTNVEADDQLKVYDSLGEMKAMSVICAPLRCGHKLLGLIHLYSTNPDNPLDVDDLEFTVAVADQFGVALDKMHQREELETGLEKVRGTAKTLRKQLEHTSELVGVSDAMNQLRATIDLIAQSDATALVRGESGVGKELVARAVHYRSKRSDGPLVCMNCAALSETLLESELFGHEKGAFTGAVTTRVGKFEQAHNATLFLDEIGDMDLALQAKLLRILQEKRFQRVGGSEEITVDVRIIAATHRDLKQMVSEKTFREDLYYRLNVAQLCLPPLRDRKGDIAILSQYFLERFCAESDLAFSGISVAALDRLERGLWPGNVRQLQNVIRKAALNARGYPIDEANVRSLMEEQNSVGKESGNSKDIIAELISENKGSAHKAFLEKFEAILFSETLKQTDGNLSKAAENLGISRFTLREKLKQYGLRS